MRVVSLLPSATEMLYELDVEPVAVSCECDYPQEAQKKPAADSSPIDSETSSASINEQVATADTGEGVYELRDDVLMEANPDVLVTQGVCDVCAVDNELVERTVDDLDLDADVVTTHPHTLADVLDDIQTLGAVTERPSRAEGVVRHLERRIDTVEERTRDIVDRPRVVVLDWMDPIMVAGHWVPEMVTLGGGSYGMADPGERSRPREFEELLDYDPDVVIVAPCGFSIEQTTDNIEEVTTRIGWENLRAVQDGNVYVMDGNHHFNRPGPRLVDGIEYLAGLLAPSRFDPPPTDDVASLSGSV